MDYKSTISDIFSPRKNLFAVPNYQRAYSWEKDKQIKQFFTDLKEHPKSVSQYHLGHFLFEADEYNKNKIEFVHYDKYFYPLDFILNWNHIYSKSGLIQYQLNVPEDKGKEAIDKVLKKVVAFGGGSFLAVLKKMGDQDGILSFPFKGYTLSMDFPVKKGVIEMCKELDRIVLEYGGRNYLTKDSIMDEKTFKQMYSGLWEKWMDTKIKYDPENKFTSNMARRLGLCPS